ncbi:MAG: DNA polymerase-1 [Rhodothermales bacterium]|jgi:DNA polymerase-1
MALIYRAYFALIRAPRMTRAGFNTSAIFGYTTTLLDILKKQKPTHIAVAFDTPEPTERHIVYPEYKANRDSMPEDLAACIPHVFRITEAFNIPVLRYPGYEADDVIGTLARRAHDDGFTTYMVTPDKDYAQLVDDRTYMYKPASRGGPPEVLGVPEILENWGIERIDQVVDILGLMGDNSDNIPGISGIGPKTAQKLIAQFGDMEGLIAGSDQLKGKTKERVEESTEIARLSRQLVTINIDVPVTEPFEDFVLQSFDEEKLLPLFAEFEFDTLGKRVFGEKFQRDATVVAQKRQPDLFDFSDGADGAGAAPELPKRTTIKDLEHTYEIADSAIKISALIAELSQLASFCFDTETTSKDAKTAELVGIAFCWQKGRAVYLPFPEDPAPLLERLRPVFENAAIAKVGHNLHYDMNVLRWHGVRIHGRIRDTMLAHYVLNPDGRHRLSTLADVYLDYLCIEYNDVAGVGGIRNAPVDRAAEYACEDADVTWQLKDILESKLLANNGLKLLHDIECPLVPVLVEMEYAGIRLDVDALAAYGTELGEEIAIFRDRVFQAADMDFNLESPKQVGDILFDRLKLDPKAKRTGKTRQYRTDEQSLERLAVKHPIVRDLLEYRACRKLESTYVQTLPQTVDARSNRVHTNYSQAVTATGRMQSHDPNLQNIPIRSARGRELRKAFTCADDAHRLLAADYSQIELRIIAALSKDPSMVAAFQAGEDIHRATAARVYGVDPEDVDSDMRSKAKMVNFGIAYGITPFGLSQRLNISRKEGNELIEQYFEKYPGVKDYIDTSIASAREHGFAETMMGRRRYLRDINSVNGSLRGAAERNAINAPIQGSAADMIKIAMVRIQNQLENAGFATRMLLQVHDELVFDLVREERQQVIPMIEREMREAMPLGDVPIRVDIGIGKNWLDAH